MFNRNKREEPGELVFDCYIGQAGLPVEPGYREITLTTTDVPDKLQMDVYMRPTGDGEKENKTTYLVSSRVLDKVMKYVQKYRMSKWSKTDYPGVCGGKYVCKFLEKNELIRVSSENMPENGKAIFSEIYSVLSHF